jgi:hypothetical protein
MVKPPESDSQRSLYVPRSVSVQAGPDGAPQAVDGIDVETVCESWLVEDRWWSEQPLRRRYFELVLTDGSDIVVFRELQGGGWFRQRA